MSVDTIGNFLTIIRNGVAVAKGRVYAPYSRVNHRIAEILKQEGFIRDVVIDEGEKVADKKLRVELKYIDGESVIHEVQRVSVPGRRIYRSVRQISPVIGGLGISVLTTSKGIMTDKEAKQRVVGGEIICTVW